MIMITEDQKDRFRESVKELVNESSEDVQKLFQKNPIITFPKGVDIPTIESNVHLNFTQKQKDKFDSLMNLLHNGVI